jgi:hypothetical protein
VGSTVTALRAFQRKLYVSYATTVWRLTEATAWDGNTVFYKADTNSESNALIAMEIHLGFLYFLSNNGHVHRTDGNTTFDIWAWDGGTRGVGIRSFDGRLFVITYEYTNTAEVGWGVLYQMSGSAMTELKRWGKDDQSNIIGSLTVYDRKLWYGASNLLGMTTRSGFGVACYDPIEDAHSVLASNTDTVTFARGSTPYTNYIVDEVFFFGGNMFAFVRGHGGFKTPYKFRDQRLGVRRYDITSAAGSLASTNGGYMTTSTYDAGTPGLRKLWRKISVDYTLPTSATGMVVEYSTDNGVIWTSAGTITTVGTKLRKDFWLNNVMSTSLKLRFTLRSTSATLSPVLYGFLVSYIPVVEPNWMWTMTLVLSEQQTLMDGTLGSMDTEAELDFLKNTYRTKQLVTYIDADGTLWATGGQPGVLIYDIAFLLRDLTQPLEGEVQLTLLEAVETY